MLLLNYIPPDAFKEIYDELKRKPIEKNLYRNKAGEGRSQTFGLVNKRSVGIDYSRQCWLRPKLLKHLLDFGEKYVAQDISYNAITVNMNFRAEKHRDRNNRGNSFLVAFGDYVDGDLLIHESDLSGSYNIRYHPIITDFSKVLHSVEAFQGERFSLVYYQFAKKGVVPQLPPCSVKEENGKYYFYRGDQKITKQNGLPHPLRNRKKNISMAEVPDASFEVVFD
jgi:hypothetical protein